MKIRSSLSIMVLGAGAILSGCVETGKNNAVVDTPTVDYVEFLNVEDAPQQDSFLNQLAMNYRSYAIYNARTSGYPEIGELFAQKAISAFSGEDPFPESLENWEIQSDSERFEIYTAYNNLMDEIKSDAAQGQPRLTAEAQAKFDCWISAAASGQVATAEECRNRFQATMQALADCEDGKVAAPTRVKSEKIVQNHVERYYPETHRLSAMAGSSRTREGLIIVNNVNIPSNLIQPVRVPNQTPMVFNQNIYGGDETISNSNNDNSFRNYSNSESYKEIYRNNGNETNSNTENNLNYENYKNNGNSLNNETYNNHELAIPAVNPNGGEYVSRDEFIAVMLALREELANINSRLDNPGKASVPNNEKTIIKVQQIPLEPTQHVMEEIFEIRFDFDKAIIKPEYDEVIKKLAATTQANKNVKVSVVGHTDTAGSSAYNYALGGRRAEAVQKMLIEYGIPSSQIIAVSAGEEDLKIQTPNNTPNAENRRVRVVKEVHYTEPAKTAPVMVEEYTEVDGCEECGKEE